MNLKKCVLLLTSVVLCSYIMQAQTRSEKRGLAYDFPVSEDIESIYQGVSWFYNWGYLPSQDENIPETIDKCNMEFIPMTWNGGIQEEKLREFYRNNPHVKYILGFNEPNFTEQANMTPTQAAAKWPVLEKIAKEFGLKIVGPAVNYGPNGGSVSENGVVYTDPVKYLDDFFAACPDCQVDYIAVHCYMPNVSALQSYIDRFRKYDKPIWLTEFCAWDGGTTELSQRKFMAEAINYLETDPDVYRYSWFIGRWNSPHPYMQIYGRYPGQLTNLGEVYVNMSSFDKNYFFSVNDTIQAQHYIEVSDGIHLEKTSDVSGKVNLMDFIMTRWVSYNIDIPESGEYEISYRVATNSTTAELVFSADGETLSTQKVVDTGGYANWTTITFDANLQKGKQRIRIDSNHTDARLNWLRITPKKGSSIESGYAESIKVFPNPTSGTVYVEGAEIEKMTLMDMAGKKLFDGKAVSSLDISNYPAGIYLLSLESQEKEKIVKKIVKIN